MINESMKSPGKTSNRRESSFNRKTSLKAVILLVFSIFVIGSLPGLKVGAAGTVSGRVFQDYNGNGTCDTANSAALPAIDAGVQNVTVTIYAADGSSKSTLPLRAEPGVSIPPLLRHCRADRIASSLAIYRLTFSLRRVRPIR